MDISSLYTLFEQHPVVTTDTRDCPEGSLFFALRGETFDGNHFALQALEAGCAYAVVDNAEVAASDARCLLVDDVLTTLQDLAAWHRRQLGTPIVQITGTNGKTTTKELTAAVLQQQYDVLYTLGNFNNHIGVPKTLLRLRPEHDIAVIETGANHPGEIALLSRIVDADCGLITNVGKAHLEGFGSFEGVIATKSELYDYLRTKVAPTQSVPAAGADETAGDDEEEVVASDPFVFLHADNPWLPARAAGLYAATYGRPGQGYDVEGEVVECNPFLRLRWRVADGEWHEVQTHLIGAYNIDNVLAAACVGTHFGVSEDQVCHALEDYRPSNSRSEYRPTDRNRLVVDAYNANLSSMHAALENFRLIDDPHKMLILGDMRELGTASAAAHQEIADLAVTTGCESIWLVGPHFAAVQPSVVQPLSTAQPAVATGLASPELRHFPDVEAVKAALAEAPVTGRLILIKGSNGTRLFQLPELL